LAGDGGLFFFYGGQFDDSVLGIFPLWGGLGYFNMPQCPPKTGITSLTSQNNPKYIFKTKHSKKRKTRIINDQHFFREFRIFVCFVVKNGVGSSKKQVPQKNKNFRKW